MSIVNTLVNDLREKRLWPIVAVLLAALVAIPLLLSNSGSRTPAAQLPAAPPAGPVTGIPAVSVSVTPARTRLRGHGRDPFTQQRVSSPSSSATATNGATPAGSTPTTAAASKPGAGTSSPATTAPSVPVTTTTPAPTIPATRPARAIPTLTDTQSYGVSVSITNAAGGVTPIDPLERLGELPSVHEPRLIELGVLKGGHRVLFAVEPDTVLSGPGACTPGPIDCEILALAQNQTEAIGVRTASGTSQLALFAVTGIRAVGHESAPAAAAARRTESAAGRALLNRSPLGALSLFHYDPSVGAVLDLRNVTVGGN
jgi:hypothetical protein